MKFPSKKKFLLLALIIFVTIAAIAIKYRVIIGMAQLHDLEAIRRFLQPPAKNAKGTLIINLFDKGTTSTPLSKHTTNFVKGSLYTGMEDNDIRGYLDGGFRYKWNQATQVHVRVGRRIKKFSDNRIELFRILQRWEPMELPPQADITDAKLRISVEVPSKMPLVVQLFNLNKDWEPGEGGVERNNNSAPKENEVWWLERAANKEKWGAPGASLASDTLANADTPTQPLATANYELSDEFIDFQSLQLTRYINTRIQQKKPLLFLIKLSEKGEDTQSSVLNIYSANYDHEKYSGNRRPQLTLDWTSGSVAKTIAKSIDLNYLGLSRIEGISVEGLDFIDVKYEKNSDSKFMPTIQLRGYDGGEATQWIDASHPINTSGWQKIDLRVIAAKSPIFEGDTFSTEYRDTWIYHFDLADKLFKWVFISPSGVKHVLNAEKGEDFYWKINFKPDEIGRWHYYWTHIFYGLKHRQTSEIQYFDVINTNFKANSNYN